MSGTSTSTHYRKGLRKISNEEEFTIDFPLELRNLDYLRRIQNQVGRAFLQMNVVIKNIIIDQNQKDKELEAAEAFANAHKQQDDDQKHPLSPSDDNDDNDDNNDNNDNDVDIDDDSGALPHSPPSKISNSTLLESSRYYQAPYFTLKTLERCLRDLLDDGSSMLESVQRRRSDSITSTHKGKLSKKTKLKIQKQVKKEKKMQLKYDSYIQKQIKYQTTWSLVLSRELSWLLDKVLWIQNIMKHIEETNMNPENSNVTDGKIKSDFQMAIDLLVVFGEANTECSCHLINIQTLRSQFVHHCTYRRERRHKEIMDEQKARGGTGTINNMNGVNDDGSFQFNYAYDFDRNGIIYYFGTISNNEEEPTTTTNEEGSKESIEHTKEELAVDDDRNWVNPSISTVSRKNPQIRAFRSSDGAGHSTDICNRKKGIYSCTDYREPRQYYGIDFGPYYRVYPNAYTLRHGSSQGILALRDWTFEGSQDGKKWFPIRKHRADLELPRLAFSTNTWKIEKPMQRKCRMLRIVQTKPVDVSQRLHDSDEIGKSNQSTTGVGGTALHETKHPKHHALFLSGMEVYGKLVEV